jgi:hypothetical protein
MNRKLTPVILVALVVSGLIVGATSLAAVRSSSYVITGARTIDGYRVGATYAQAVRVLGGSYSTTQTNKTCTARWANGVTIVWHRTLPYAKWSKACLRFSFARVQRARVAAPNWRTDKGLRVGASESQLKRLYPAATAKLSSGYRVWTLAKASRIKLQAWAKKGHVAFFRLTTS